MQVNHDSKELDLKNKWQFDFLLINISEQLFDWDDKMNRLFSHQTSPHQISKNNFLNLTMNFMVQMP